MHPPDTAAKRFRFGPFELDCITGELRKHGVPVRLPDQSFRVLLTLVEHQGQVIAREDLQRELWADGTFVDFDHGLNLAVNRLRQALGEAAGQPRYIETLPRKGYRFVAPIEVIGPAEALKKTAQPGTRVVSLLPRFAWLGAAAVVGVLGLLALRSRHAAREPEFLPATPLTSYAGSQFCPSFAPDGDRVAFSWNGDKQDNFDIYIQQVGVETPLRLTRDPSGDLSPAWSPDGRSIAFIRLLPDSKAAVMLTSALPGGPERRLAEIAAPRADYRDLRFLSWSPDGKWLVVADARSTFANFGLFLLSIENGDKRRLTDPRQAYDDFDPVFSPDMRRLAFVRHSGWSLSDVYVVELSERLQPDAEPRPVTFDHLRSGSPVWSHDGKALLITRYSQRGRPGLWKITPSDPPRSEPLPISTENAFALAISPKGDRLVYTRESFHGSIWALDLSAARHRIAQQPASRLLIDSTRRDLYPTFSSDGGKIAFQSMRSGWPEIWIADSDGSHERQMTNLRPMSTGPAHWSPDGTKLAFHVEMENYAHLFLLDLATGRAQALNLPQAIDRNPSWSRDGKWIYFTRRMQDAQVWKVPAQGGAPVQLTKNGGLDALESLDGRFVFYAKLNNGLWRMPVSGGEEEQIVPETISDLGLAYAPARTGIYFVTMPAQSGKETLKHLNFATGQTTSIAELGYTHLALAVSPNEQTVLYSALDHWDSDLMLVENFR